MRPTSSVEAAALARWRAHELCGAGDGWPGAYWGPERLEPAAWRELAAMLEPAAERDALVAALAGVRNVVDVGGGTGLLTRTLAERVGPVIVVEPSAEQRAHAPAVAGATMVDGRAEAVPLADGAVDAAVATWVLQYTDQPWAAVYELARVARRRVAIVQAAPGNQLVAAYNLAAEVAGLPAAHHGYLLAQAAALLEARGFEIELTRVGIPLVAAERAADEVADVLVRLHFAGHPREAAMRAAVEPAVASWLAQDGRLVDDGVLLVARR